MSPARFCDFCEDLLLWIVAHRYETNRNSAPKKPVPFSAGCPLCVMFDCVLDRERYARLASDSDLFLKLVGSDDSFSLELGAIAPTVDGFETWQSFSGDGIFILLDEAAQRKECAYNTPECTSTWSLASVNRVISWLSTCKDSHSDCNTNVTPNLGFPRRLIDVDPEGCISASPASEAELEQLSLANMPKVRLCETRSFTNRPGYLTLSHRWDPSSTLLLRDDNLSQFLEAIPTSSLNLPGSKTFRDAIHVTRCLGFRYLWIDTICINQRQIDNQGSDVKDELLAELSIMHQIYANSACNISATSPRMAADGLFFSPLGPQVAQALENMSHKLEKQGQANRMAVLFGGDLGEFIDSAPLNKRGWVYQERMLSPRVIHFTNLEVYWKCFEKQWSEHHDWGLHGRPVEEDRVGRKTDLGISTKGPSWMNNRWFDPDTLRWCWLTTMYSGLSLSHLEDKLPALSALARHFQIKRNLRAQDYVAGHWRNDLWWTLQWEIESRLGRQEALYLAPSWSWAPVGCPVKGGLPSLSLPGKLVEVLDASVVCENNDAFGKIKSGSLRLRCHLSRAFWGLEESKLSVVADGKLLTSDALITYWDLPIPPVKKTENSLGSETTRSLSTSSTWVPRPGNGRAYILDNRFFLALLFYSEIGFCGLVLYPTAETDQFVRVGTFEFKLHYSWKHRERSGCFPLKTHTDNPTPEERKQRDEARQARRNYCTEKDYEKYDLDSDDDECFYGMMADDARVARALLCRQDGNKGPLGSSDAGWRQVIEIT